MVFWGESAGCVLAQFSAAQRRGFRIEPRAPRAVKNSHQRHLQPLAVDLSQPHRHFETPARDLWAEQGTDRRCLLKLLRSPPTALVSQAPPLGPAS